MNGNTNYETVVLELSQLIMLEMCRFRSEYTAPSRTADDMDDFLRESKLRVKKLRELRDAVEMLAAGFSKYDPTQEAV